MKTEVQDIRTVIPSVSLNCGILYNRCNIIRSIIIFLIMTISIYIVNEKIIIKLSFRENISSKIFSNGSRYGAFYFNASSRKQRFDVVISYYAENVAFVARFIHHLRNVSSLQRLKLFIIVYNKNPNINNSFLQETLKADLVQQLPNVGREGGTYLYHIIKNYDTLADHILFSQAGVEGTSPTGLDDWFLNRLEKQFNRKTGYMPLVSDQWIEIYDCGLNKNNNMPRLAELWTLIEQTLCPPEKQAIAFRGQFLVSSERIRKRPLRIYKYINDLLMANSTHWIHRDPRSPIGVSTPSNPFFGHIVERLWTTLFDCSKPDLLSRCQRNECSCLD